MTKAGYKNTEIGRIPEDWEVKSLLDAAPLQRGFDLPKAEQQIGPYPVVYSNGICSYHNKFMVKGPGVITGRSGTIGSVHYVESNYWPHNTALWVTKFNGNYPLYVYYLFQTIDWKLYSTGSGVPTLNRNDVHEKLLPFPSYDEQIRIAEALSKRDSLIRNLDRTIEKKKNIRQGATEQLLSGKTRALGREQEWKECALAEIINVVKGQQINGSELLEKGPFPMINGGIEPSGYTTDYNADADTITISEGGNSCGYVNYIHQKFWAGGHCYCVVIRNNELIERDFLFHMLKYYEKTIMGLRVGSGLPNVQSKMLLEMRVSYPIDIKEQRAIAATLTAMDDEIAVLQMERDKYANIRAGMMDDLLTGAKRI